MASSGTTCNKENNETKPKFINKCFTLLVFIFTILTTSAAPVYAQFYTGGESVPLHGGANCYVGPTSSYTFPGDNTDAYVTNTCTISYTDEPPGTYPPTSYDGCVGWPTRGTIGECPNCYRLVDSFTDSCWYYVGYGGYVATQVNKIYVYHAKQCDYDFQTQPCTTTGTAGYSCSGTQTCYARFWSDCQPDPSCSQCTDGQTSSCTTSGTAGYPCTGTTTCSGGVWSACQPDASCDQCADGLMRVCTTGCTIGGGLQTCAGGQWGGCVCTNPCQTADCGNKCNGATCNTQCVGSSVNLKSGNLAHNQDVITAPKSLPFVLTYNSNDPTIGPLGRGWTHTYNVLISAVTNTSGNISSLTFTEDSGNKIKFTPSGSVYFPDASSGDTSTIAINADNTYTRTLKDGTLQIFDASGMLTSIKDRNNNTTMLSYSGSNLTTITDSTGRSLVIANTGRIASITDPAGNVYNFTYSGDLLTSVTDPAGKFWTYTYDTNGRMLTKTDPAGFQTTYTHDAKGMFASATDSNGLSRTISYDQTNSNSQFTEKDGGVWSQKYDSQLNLPTQKTDPQGNITNYSYDNKGNMLTKTDPDNSVTVYTYDAKSNVTSIIDALGQTTVYTYNNFSEVLSMRDPLGNITTYTYDANGNLLSTTDPLGAISTYQYDSKGNITTITNALIQPTTLTYDQYNNIASITDPTSAVTGFTYDINGNMTSRIDAKGNTTLFSYNNLNHLIQVIDPNGNTTTFAYDPKGNRTLQTDANGNATYYEYSQNGKPTQVKDALNGITSFAYTGAGCSSCSGVDKLNAIVDANGNTTQFFYDALGRLTQESPPNTSGGENGNSTRYSYDAKGNLISKTDANRKTTTYTYDAVGRLSTIVYPYGAYSDAFTYDAKGNALTVSGDNITYSYTYDANGRVTSVTSDYGDTVSYTYDVVGNRTQMTYPDGSTVNYIYNAANRLTKIKDGNKNYTFTYDKTGKRKKLTFPHGASANYTYDLSGKLTSLIHTSSTGTIIASFAYTLDRVGNRLTSSGMNGGDTYSYDAVYNLQSALPGGNADYGPEEYTYDLMGNRLIGPKPHRAYTYNQGNQLVTENNQQFQYDNNGNLISHVTASTTFSYSYDYSNRLTQVVKDHEGTVTTTAYYYDTFGRRIQKDVTTDTGFTSTRYVYDGQNVIVEYNNDTGVEKSRYVHGPNIDEPLAMVRGVNNVHHYYHADGLGSIVAITDRNQQVVETYTYSAFGVVKGEGNGIRNPYRFAGREWDASAGLYHNRARYYDPRTGRFISKDPIGLAGGINLYAYVGNNPVNYSDPLGLWRNPWDIYDEAMQNAALSGLPGVHNGLQDAYRHCLASCISTVENGMFLTWAFGEANEMRGNWFHNQQRGERCMDYNNNAAGSGFGDSASSTANCQNSCMNAATNGTLQTYTSGTTPGYWY